MTTELAEGMNMNRTVLAPLLGLALATLVGWHVANAEDVKNGVPEKAAAVAGTVEKERKEFVAAAEADLRKLKAEMRELKQKAAAKTRAEKATLTEQTRSLKNQLKMANRKLAELKSAAPEKWRELKADAAGAIDHLKQSIRELKGDRTQDTSP